MVISHVATRTDALAQLDGSCPLCAALRALQEA